MGKTKKLDFNDYWAQTVYRTTTPNGDDCYFALCRKKYGDGFEDIERKGVGTYIGIEETPVYEMETDRDPESETFGKRIPRERVTYTQTGTEVREPILVETRAKFIHKANDKYTKEYQKLCGFSPVFGNTQYIWVIGHRKTTCNNPEQFWTTPLKVINGEVPEPIAKGKKND
jgi:hypothetical protein